MKKCDRTERNAFDLIHDFYVVFGKQCRTENAQTGHQQIPLYKLTNVLLLFICFKFVMKFMRFCFIIYFNFKKNIFIMLKT